jgi:hypothetical protein
MVVCFCWCPRGDTVHTHTALYRALTCRSHSLVAVPQRWTSASCQKPDYPEHAFVATAPERSSSNRSTFPSGVGPHLSTARYPDGHRRQGWSGRTPAAEPRHVGDRRPDPVPLGAVAHPGQLVNARPVIALCPPRGVNGRQAAGVCRRVRRGRRRPPWRPGDAVRASIGERGHAGSSPGGHDGASITVCAVGCAGVGRRRLERTTEVPDRLLLPHLVLVSPRRIQGRSGPRR